MEHGSAKIGEVFNFGMLHLEWPTALFILVIFVLTMIVLNLMLFKPIIKTLEARQSEMDKDKAESDSLAQTVAKSEQDYEAKLSETREVIQITRQEAVNKALANAKELISQTKEAVSQKLEASEKELQGEKSNALKEAAALTESLSQLIKSKVLA